MQVYTLYYAQPHCIYAVASPDISETSRGKRRAYLTMYAEEHFTFWFLQTLVRHHDVYWIIAQLEGRGTVLK